MKKYLTSHLTTPIFFSLIWLTWMCCIFIFQSDNLASLIDKNSGFLEEITNWAYLPLLFAYICFAKLFWAKGKSARTDFVLFVALGIAAFLRENGIQHWIPSKDTTAFKSRFFLNPDNPLSEKILAGFLLLLLLAVILYLALKYTKHLISSFFKMDPTTWSIATLCTLGVFGKFIDRFPSNYKHSAGVPLPEQLTINLGIVEETSEIMLPLIASFILLQYWLLKKTPQN